jgi:hypothetical protein
MAAMLGGDRQKTAALVGTAKAACFLLRLFSGAENALSASESFDCLQSQQNDAAGRHFSVTAQSMA